jgi:hypothetical protein
MRPEGQMFPAGSALVSGEVAELAPEVKIRGPEPVRRWPLRGGASEESGISPEWLLREASAEEGGGGRETLPEEPEEELGVRWAPCLEEEECGSGETGERRPGGRVSGLSVDERRTAAAKASERVSGIGAGGRWDIPRRQELSGWICLRNSGWEGEGLERHGMGWGSRSLVRKEGE